MALKNRYTSLMAGLLLCAPAGADGIATMRHQQAIAADIQAPELVQEESLGHPRVRSYPMQAPTIPHAITGFAINQHMNMCLNCHNRNTAPLMKAPAIGLSHYQNRDQDYLADMSPRRFFCTQCHVPQQAVPLPVNSRFIRMEQASQREKQD